jgi:general secretion pathway protein D
MKRSVLGAALLLAIGLTAGDAAAQLAPRGKPILRTPAARGILGAGGAAKSADPTGAGATGSGATGSGATRPAESKDAGTKPTDAKADDAKPGDAKPGDAKPSAPKPGDAVTTREGSAPPGAGDPFEKLSAPKEIEYKPRSPNALVTLNLEEADLPELVKAISQTTGKRFLYGSAKLKQIKATVVTGGPNDKITVAEAYSVFLAILEANGLTVIPHGSFLKIVEAVDVAKQNTPIFGTGTPVPAEDRFVTRLYRLTNIDASEVSTILTQNFKSKDASITVYPPGNLLIITDTGSNIRRMLRIVEELDVGSAGDQIWVQPIYNASASDAASKLNEILGGGKGGKGAALVIADERTNSLIITATRSDYERILELVKRVVDAPLVAGDDQIHVLPLQHAQCSELQGTISQLLGGGGGRPASKGGAKSAAPAAAAAGGAGGGGEEIFEGPVKVSCDEATNTLLTTSSLRDYAQLRAVIDELDQPRRQVFIEAVIMDLNVSRSQDVGVGYHSGAPVDFGDLGQGAFYGGNNLVQSVSGIPSQLGALALGLRGPEIEGTENLFGTGLSVPALGVVLHALANDSNSNVLATPHILATDNVQADISVGQSVPLQTNIGGNLGALAGLAGGAAGAGAALGGLGGGLGGLLGGGFAAPYKDVGIKLSIKPHVNDSDQVRLEVKEEISEVGSSPQGTLGAVSINQRTANTTLIVRDQQTVVIGGLMREQETVSETKVPLLGDIPVLGMLFRQQTKTKGKTNLMLILTPYVIRDQNDLRSVFERKMQERQEFLDRYFVFGTTKWEPPNDFSRANGVVEAIRQSMLTSREKARLERETRPRAPKTNEPVEPIALPSVAEPVKSGGTGGGTSAPAAASPQAPSTSPASGGASTSAGRGKVKAPIPPGLPRPVERVE